MNRLRKEKSNGWTPPDVSEFYSRLPLPCPFWCAGGGGGGAGRGDSQIKLPGMIVVPFIYPA